MQAIKESEKYPKTIEGLTEAIKNHGGIKSLESALKATQSAPVRLGLKMVGVDVNKLDNVAKEVRGLLGGSETSTANSESSKNTSADELLDRIRRR
ncbi:MAG: hypothetical protein RR795_01615 [Cetobacterium sp.]|uniref:hypothetical protein n=1 Tax=Cetobacterium sp. TaxID=2071632 RepID=UPI002FC7C500